MMKRFALLLALAGICLQGRAAVLPPEKLLPKDTVLVVTAPDWPKAWAFLTNSSYGRLWQDPAIRPFKDKFIEKFTTEALKPLEQNLGIKFSDYQGLAQGQVTFALLPVAQKENPDRHFSQVLLIDTKDHAAQLKTNLASITKKWIDAGKADENPKDPRGGIYHADRLPVRSFLEQNFSANQVRAPRDRRGLQGAGKKHRNHFGQVDSLLIVADSPCGHREGSDVAAGRLLCAAGGGAVVSIGFCGASASGRLTMPGSTSRR